jgi:hypothetical protein
MSTFDFVSHESYPEDQYIAEAVTLCFENKYRVTYIRKKMQNGGMFWSEISAAVTKQGEKKYLKSFSQDSNFLQEDIKSFLDQRSWEKLIRNSGSKIQNNANANPNAESEEVPF